MATSTDTEWDAHGTVTAAVAAGDGYTASDTERAATRDVKDNDFPDASLSLLGIPDPVEEGHDETIHYVFLTGADEQPHKSTGEFSIVITGGTAVVDTPGDGVDVLLFAPVDFSAGEGDFTRVDIDDDQVAEDWRWRATASIRQSLTVVDDNDEEDAEQFTIALEPFPEDQTIDPADPNITVVSPGTVEIAASDQSDLSEDATLSGLALSTANSNPTLSPQFAGGTATYTASVPFGEARLTIAPTANHSEASVSYRLGTGGSHTAVTGGSFQVNLAEGDNVIEVLVTAEDPRYTQTYTITVTREPQVAIAVATAAAVTEGGDVVFTVTRSRGTDTGLEVDLTVTDVGNVLDAGREGSKTVTIAANQRSVPYTVTTTDNTAFVLTSSITVTVRDGDGYTASATAGSATKAIRDDDFPGAEVTVAVDKAEAAEGESVTATVTVQTDFPLTLHTGVNAGVVVLRASDSASSTPGTDYPFTESELQFNRGDFNVEDVDPGIVQDYRWVARKTVTIRITDDNDEEGDEDLTLLLVRPDPQQESDALHPNVRLGTATATVSIPANDSADTALSALAVTDGTDSIGHLTPGFRAGVTQYRAGVGFDTASVTLSATSNDDEARVSVAGGPSQDMTSSRTVNLSVGDNALAVVVTAENGVTTETYTVTVTRAPQVTSLTPAASDPATAYPTTVTYDIVFRGRWNRQVTPSGVPGGAHFTTLIGGVHSDAATFVEAGGTATDGVELMAEAGVTTRLRSEVQAAVDADPPTAHRVVSQSVGSGPTATATLNEVEFTSEFPRLTLTSMVAPTPDWFVGVSGLRLLDDRGRWLRSHSVNLYPWDAGTEDDVSQNNGFSLGGENTRPKERIRSLRGAGPFTIQRIGFLEFTLHSIATTRQLDENTAAGTNIGLPVTSPVAPPAGSGTITYSLAGADAGSFEINSDTGQLRTKAGVDYDYEDRSGNGYALTVVATDTGPDPDVVTNIEVAVVLRNTDEVGEMTVTPATVGVDVLLTASLADPDGGVTGETWAWERSDNGTSGWSTVAGTTAAYTPVAADEAKYLRVTVTYDDAQGTGRSLTKALGQVAASTTLSDDSTLSALSLSGLTLSPSFSASEDTYTASAGYTTVQTTVTATANAAADGPRSRSRTATACRSPTPTTRRTATRSRSPSATTPSSPR